MTHLKSFIVAAFTLVVGLGLSGTAAQAEWPEKPIKIFVGFGAGGGTDTYARIVASLIHEELDGTPMVVINKPGASGAIALKHVNSQAADGYTVLLAPVGPVVTTELLGKSDVNFREDMVAIGTLGKVPAALAVPFSSPHQTIADLVAHAKANPGSVRWANPSRTGLLGMGFLKVASQLEIDVEDVPFNGGGPTKAAIVANQVDFGLVGIQHLVGFEEKLRGLGVFAPERSGMKDDVPTFAEQGYDVANIVQPFSIFVKSDTPEEIVEKLRTALKAVTEKEGYTLLMSKAGLDNDYGDAAETKSIVDQMFEDLAP